jgi:hypothetical protein
VDKAVSDNWIADAGSADHYNFIRLFIEHFSRLLGIFRNGVIPADGRLYWPLTTSPASHIAFDPGVPASGLQELAVAIATLGLGVRLSLWTLHPVATGDPMSGALEIQTSVRRFSVFFVASEESSLKLFSSGRLSSREYGIVIHSKTVIDPKPRSPARSVGRTGARKLRAVGISALLQGVSTVAELTQRFQREVAL